MKRRKDSGFTLIELMIVIAVIGILAIVLIPRVGVVKNTAKEAGLQTNVRLVQGYVESKISNWVTNDIDQSVVVGDIAKSFTFTDATKELVNPITNAHADATSGADDAIAGKPSIYVCTDSDAAPDDVIAAAEGSVVVAVIADDTDEPVKSVVIYAYGNEGKRLTEVVTITP